MYMRNKKNGFAIIYTMLVITMAVGISMGVANVVYKERALSRIGRDSLNARSAADVGMECMLYNDKMPTQFDPGRNPVSFLINCGRDIAQNPVVYVATLTTLTANNYVYTVDPVVVPDGPCFKAYMERTLIPAPIATKIDVFGYNVCDTASTARVERGIIAEY